MRSRDKKAALFSAETAGSIWDRFQTIPKEMAASLAEDQRSLPLVQGVPMPRFFKGERAREVLSYRPVPGDVFVATYPKCGTTWAQYIAWCVVNLEKVQAGGEVPTLNDLLNKDVPFLEWTRDKTLLFTLRDRRRTTAKTPAAEEGSPGSSRMSEGGKEDFFMRGFRFPSAYNPNLVHEALSYEARPGDVFVSTYVKCGTTWLQYLVWCVHNLDVLAAGGGVPTMNDLLHKHVPFLELVGTSCLDQLPEPRLMKHHLPFSLAPYHTEAKYVVVFRNPFDCATSYYHMRRENAPANGLPRDYDFDSFFETFVTGQLPYGLYFDHVLSWYEHRNDSNVHILYFEELKEDTAKEILKLADFLDAGGAGQRLRSDCDLLQTVIDKTSFKNLKTAAIPDTDLQDEDIGGWHKPKGPSRSFFRKGAIGDWRNYFSAEQEERLKKMYFDRLGHTDMVKVWKKHLGF